MNRIVDVMDKVFRLRLRLSTRRVVAAGALSCFLNILIFTHLWLQRRFSRMRLVIYTNAAAMLMKNRIGAISKIPET